MADIATTREMILLCREASISLFLWGAHGIGKSSIVTSCIFPCQKSMR